MEYYLCVLDFEATCWENSENKEQMEIIEFPSVLYKINEINGTCEFISEFAKYVKPTMNPQLTKFCTELTGITQETVNSAETIDKVYLAHSKWIESHVPYQADFVFATCGHWDLRTQLPREIRNKNLKTKRIYKTYINVKDEFEYFYKRKAGGMLGILDFLSLKLDGRHHSGIDDTKNIAKIMLTLIKSGHRFSNFYFNTLKI
jgi:inhibitor of KinA sporulation pathway (predicted exonuclease)